MEAVKVEGDMVNRLSGGSVSHRWSRGGGGSVTLEKHDSKIFIPKCAGVEIIPLKIHRDKQMEVP